ncbi:MAG: hypothetical protein N5P05_002682 [Chroococcopsis gigantea SAG 12.99]|jgi:CHAT domain-containing protein|nr:CHAT domain-containing protein [Chlorogloea purpurea SAG 13.99]MDV3001076.1 hypothetical protein [Chroococcopsis gigantea SAG 12.99]
MSKKWYVSFLFGSGLLFIFWIHYLLVEPVRAGMPPRSGSVEQARDYYVRGRFGQAIELIENLLPGSTNEERPLLYCYLAASYRESGQLNKAIRNWKAALEIYRDQKEEVSNSQLTAVLVDLGQTYNALGQFRNAIPLLQEAIKLTERNGDSKTEAIAADILATSQTIAGNYDEAIRVYQESIDLLDKLNLPESRIITLNNLSKAFSERRSKYLSEAKSAEMEENETDAERFLKLAQEDGTSALKIALQAEESSRNLKSLSAVRARLALMKLNPELDYRDWARSLLESLPDSRRKVYELIDLGGLMETPQAIGILEEGIAIAEKLGDSRTTSFALGALGRLYEEKKQYTRALEYTHSAGLAAGQIAAADSQYRWQWQAGRIYRATGQLEEAKMAYRGAIASLGSIRGDIAVIDQNLQLDFRDEVEPVYRGLLEILLEGGMPEEVKEAIEVFEALQLSQLQNFFGDDCVEITDALSNPGDFLARTNTAVIHSIILEEKTYLILQREDGDVKSYPIDIPREKLQEKLLKWRYQLEDISTYRYKDLSRQLYGLLIEPLEADLDNARPDNIVFINDGLLRNVPMGALHDGQEFLAAKYPVSVSLGLNFLRNPGPRGALRSLTFGLSQAISPFEALPNVKLETGEVQSILGGSRYLDADFTSANLEREIRKQDYPVVHLATHGRFGGNAEGAFLQAFDGQISLTGLEKLLGLSRQPIELLTLSACQTVAGNDRATLGLAGVALRSGVKSALGTLWFVNDEATVELIADFYGNLRAGMSKTEALREAQLRQIQKPDAHPSSWSAFVLIGNWS